MTFKIGDSVHHANRRHMGLGTVTGVTDKRVSVVWEKRKPQTPVPYRPTSLVTVRPECMNTRCPTPGLCVARCYCPKDNNIRMVV
jgi:hypothetical protein